MSFFARLKLAFLFLFGRLSAKALASLPSDDQPAPQLPATTLSSVPAGPAASQHDAALFLLGLLQREGRFLDFVQEDIASYGDADVGAAARLVHEGCRKVVTEYLKVSAIVSQPEGASISVPQGFNASQFRLTGNVSGDGPWKGTLKHHGWKIDSHSLPTVPTTVDLRAIAPAEVEIP